MNRIILMSFILALGTSALSNPLSESSLLRKMSLRLKGVPPSIQEYTQLEKERKAGTSKKFLDQKAIEYTADPLFVQKMVLHLHELFRVSAPAFLDDLSRPPKSSIAKFLTKEYKLNNSLGHLFHEIIAKDLSWDSLLTKKDYILFPILSPTIFDIEDKKFFERLNYKESPVLDKKVLMRWLDESASLQPVNAEFATEDSRIAGAVTTARFFRRYTNSALNKNRRRAAGLFRIFLCDEMEAKIEADSNRSKRFFDLLNPVTTTDLPDHPTNVSNKDIHGDRPDCRKCHYKLDPMGKVFAFSGTRLSNKLASGALVYTNSSGKLVKKNVKGLGELGEAIVSQNDYVSCQVKHFWNWFVGDANELSENELKVHSSKFNQLGRKPGAFVRYLVTQNAFSFHKVQNRHIETALMVKDLFNRCMNCHKTSVPHLPDFTVWPIGGTKDSMALHLNSIYLRMDLKNWGSNQTMPPSNAGWMATPTQVRLLREWMSNGAPDSSGVPQSNPIPVGGVL